MFCDFRSIKWLLFVATLTFVHSIAIEARAVRRKATDMDVCARLAIARPGPWKDAIESCLTWFRERGGIDEDATFVPEEIITAATTNQNELSKPQTDLSDLYTVRSEAEGTEFVRTKEKEKPREEEVKRDFFQSDDGLSNEQPVWKRMDVDVRPWPTNFRRVLQNINKRHTFSINSALVSLADMLVAARYNQDREKQRAFQRYLIGLGR